MSDLESDSKSDSEYGTPLSQTPLLSGLASPISSSSQSALGDLSPISSPSQSATEDPESISSCCLRKCCSLSSILFYPFYGLSFITFQYIHRDLSRKKCLPLQILYTVFITVIIGLAVNIGPFGMFLYDWIECPMEYHNICFILEFHSNEPNNMPVVVMRGNEGDYINNEATRQAVQPFDDLAKFTFLFILVSGALSYVFFIISLIHHYIFYNFCCKPKGNDSAEDHTLFHPFDDTNNSASTKLLCTNWNEIKGCLCFYAFFIANVLFLLASLLLYFCLQYNTKEVRPPSSENKYSWFEGVTVFIFFYSHWCSVISCFIFAKIMYGIQNKIIVAGDDISSDNFDDLIKKDEQLIKRATKTLNYFQLWFFIHWVFYIITSFLMIALSIEAILLLIRATQAHNQPGVHFSDGEICLLVLLSISNVLMFIYPCFRAAGITRARKKYIQNIIKKYSKTEKGYNNAIKLYVKHLKSQDFGFRLNIGCTHIPFNLNVAYTSILIGAFGIVLSILTSVAT